MPGTYADFDATGKLIGIEVLDASEVLGDTVQFEVELRHRRSKRRSELIDVKTWNGEPHSDHRKRCEKYPS